MKEEKIECEDKRLWVIPNDNYWDRGLQDGKGKFIGEGLNISHSACCNSFAEEFGFQVPECGPYQEYARYFNKLGFVIVFNSAIKLDEKYFASIFLPEQLSEKQIAFFETKRSLFENKYHSDVAFFEAVVYTTKSLDYKSQFGYRSLKIESIISGKGNNNGQELLYQELDRQLENIGELKVGSESQYIEASVSSSIKRR